MSSTNIKYLLNMFLRGLTLFSKFILVLFLARYLKPGQVGLYGLLTATISYVLYLVGLDFYTYTTREIIKTDKKLWGGILKNQIFLVFILYIVFLPFTSLIFVSGALPWPLVGWFFLLLILEHFAQELNRLFVAIEEQLLASAILFFRMGAWALVVALIMHMYSSSRTLWFVLLSWGIGGSLACMVGMSRLYYLRIGGWKNKIDINWIWRGVRVALPLLCSSLALRGLYTVDKYWVGDLTSMEVLGAYTLFMGMASALGSFLDSGVFVFVYPRLVSDFYEKRCDAFRSNMRKLFCYTMGICIIYSSIALLSYRYLLLWLHKPLYVEHQTMFPWLLLAMVEYAIGMVPHYALYAQHHDRQIIISHIVGLFSFLAATWIFSYKWPILAVPVGLSVAFGTILIWKIVAYRRFTPREYRGMLSWNFDGSLW